MYKWAKRLNGTIEIFEKRLKIFFSVRVVVRLYQKWTMAAATTSHALVAVSFAGFVWKRFRIFIIFRPPVALFGANKFGVKRKSSSGFVYDYW